ncbi:MAG: FAD-binding oxidoreductase [Bdellovibrionales bacterium]
MASNNLQQELTRLLPADQVRLDQEAFEIYGKDWTKHITPKPSAVTFPKTTAQVKALVDWARTQKMALVPSGGRTGLSGAAIAYNGEVVVSFERMNRILEFDPFDQTVVCEPGVITEQLQNYALEKGLYFPVDFASRGSSQVGGNIATNAGGIKVLRYGLFRNWVAGLQVVTGSGEVLELNKSLVKNATGYDLRHLFIGSEGTLGLITQATMQLTRPPQELAVFLFAVPNLGAVMKIYHAFKSKTSLIAYEMFTDLALKYVTQYTGLKSPLNEASPYYVVVEIEKDSATAEDTAMQIFESGIEKGWLSDGLLAQTPQQAKDFWRFREDISEATAPGKPYKNDISVRIAKVPEFLLEMDALLKSKYPTFEVVWFGHIGDGNLHINIIKPANLTSEEFLKQCHAVDEHLFDMIERFGGSVSAEHGVGLTKKPYLSHTKSIAEIEIMRKIKRQFDPDGIMNPGKIFD